MSFKSKLYNIIDELQQYHNNKLDALSSRIQERLDKTLDSYTNMLSASVDYLSSRNDVNVMKKLNRGT